MVQSSTKRCSKNSIIITKHGYLVSFMLHASCVSRQLYRVSLHSCRGHIALPGSCKGEDGDIGFSSVNDIVPLLLDSLCGESSSELGSCTDPECLPLRTRIAVDFRFEAASLAILRPVLYKALIAGRQLHIMAVCVSTAVHMVALAFSPDQYLLVRIPVCRAVVEDLHRGSVEFVPPNWVRKLNLIIDVMQALERSA